jgi:hypothetical protein
VKTILATALVLATGFAAYSIWGWGHARHLNVSSSQIFIHGTPVCITQRGGEILAAVGECGISGGGREEGFDESRRGILPPGHPPVMLPPGHPPVESDPGPVPEKRRRTLI